MDEDKRLYLEQEIQEMMEAFEPQSNEKVWNALFRELPESKDGIEAYPDLVYRTAALACLIERGVDPSESGYLKTKLAESTQDHFFGKERGDPAESASTTLSNLIPSGQLKEIVESFYARSGSQAPDTIANFDSPLQSTLAASWMLAALEIEEPGTVYLPIVRLPEVLSLHTNNLLLRQPYFLRFEPESMFMHAVSLVRKRKDFDFLAKVEQAFRNGTRLHGWLFQEMISCLGLHFDQGIITLAKDCSIEDTLEHQLAEEVRNQLIDAVPAELAEKLKRVQLKVMHFAVAQRVGMWGDYDVGWLFFLQFLERRLPVQRTNTLLAGMAVPSRDWWAFPSVTIATKRPVISMCDVNGAPHRQDGKAIEFADGFGAYAIDGERVPAEEFESRAAASREQSKLLESS
jgi:hypothetical protein